MSATYEEAASSAHQKKKTVFRWFPTMIEDPPEMFIQF